MTDFEHKIIRVFPRRTKWSPIDELCFFDEPPLFVLPDLPVHVSVLFTWDIKRGKELTKAWRSVSNKVSLGGPAFGDRDGEFQPGWYIKPGVTITSRGCPKRCPWCLIPHGQRPHELHIKPGYIIQDDNLLACTVKHIETVFEMLKCQSRQIEFKGGLDIDYLRPWHIKLLTRIRVKELWVSCDRPQDVNRLDKAHDLFSDYKIDQRHCYVLMGFDGDTPDAAAKRCEQVYAKGFMPFAMFYRGDGPWEKVPQEWRFVQSKWIRPAAYQSKKPRLSPNTQKAADELTHPLFEDKP